LRNGERRFKEVFAYRMLALEGSFVDVGALMFLLALSAIFGYGIVFERIPDVISAWMPLLIASAS
jgi:hypothetical protein